MIKPLTMAIALFASATACAAPAFYTGKINKVWTDDQTGGFVVTFSGDSGIKDCKNEYVLFRAATMQPKMLANALSLAL